MRREDLLFHAGGECLQQFGTLLRKTLRAEDVGYTHTRTGTAAAYGPDGVLTTSAANIPRVDWSSGAPALLVEAAGTNQFIQSQAFDNAAWAKIRTTVTANDAVAPDGTTTADLLVEDSSTNTHNISDLFATQPADNVPYGFSVFAKASTRSIMRMQLTGKDSSTQGSAFFDLATGTIGTVSDGTASIQSYDDGWYRCFLGAEDSQSGGSGAAGIIYTIASGETVSYAGDGTSGIRIWQADADNAKSFIGSPIVTSGTAATRGADTFYAELLHPPQEMTVYLKFDELGTALVTNYGLFQIGSATATTSAHLAVYTSATAGRYQVSIHNGSASGSAVIGASGAIGVGYVGEVRISVASDGSTTFGISIDGAAEVTTTTSALSGGGLPVAWADTRLYIGSLGSTNQGLNAFHAVKIARGIQSMTDMRAV